ncbi:transposase [Bacillaceae bacterium S4-13-58]
MGRRKRIWLPNYFYHIVCRGNRRDPLFNDEHDFLTYLYILRHIYDRYPFEIASYCIVTNHLHLQLTSPEHPISKIMSLVNKRYADYYNTKYKMTGHVYEKRYFDKIIPDPLAMLEVSRYIHQSTGSTNGLKSRRLPMEQLPPFFIGENHKSRTLLQHKFVSDRHHPKHVEYNT